MSDNEHEHYVVERTAPKWVVSSLVTVGSGLATILLVWIASSQLNINTQMAVIVYKLEAQEELFSDTRATFNDQFGTLLDNQNRIWPRLRNHGENISILRRALEEQCQCTINLEEPEGF